MKRKRVFHLWACIDGRGNIVTDPDGRAPYLWDDRADAEGIVELDDDRVQRVKVTIEPAGPPHKPRG